MRNVAECEGALDVSERIVAGLVAAHETAIVTLQEWPMKHVGPG